MTSRDLRKRFKATIQTREWGYGGGSKGHDSYGTLKGQKPPVPAMEYGRKDREWYIY